jgi:hypothetical protein
VNLTHFYSSNAMDDDGVVYKMRRTSSSLITTFDTRTGLEVTNTIPAPPTNLGGVSNSWNLVHGIAYFPTMGANGSLVHVNSSEGRINRLDLDTEVWTNLAINKNISPSSGTAHYNRFSDQVVVTGGGVNSGTYIIESDGTVIDAPNIPVTISSDSNFVSHPSASKSLLYSQSDSKVYTCDYSDTGNISWDAGVAATGELATVIGSPNMVVSTIDGLGTILLQSYSPDGNSKVVIHKPN